MAVSYKILSHEVRAESVIKKSRFIAIAFPIQSREDAKDAIQKVSEEFSDARHVCWAYLLGNPSATSSAASNDAGEPSGTAGRPILNVIQHKGIGDVLIVVVRYFGGIKLGAGGLVRAYSGAAEQVLSLATFAQIEPQVDVRLRFPFAQEQYLRHVITSIGAAVVRVDYSEEVEMRIKISPSSMETLSDRCAAHGVELHELK